jgi:hypothetical protein
LGHFCCFAVVTIEKKPIFQDLTPFFRSADPAMAAGLPAMPSTGNPVGENPFTQADSGGLFTAEG